MAWNFMQLILDPNSGRGEPMIGPGGLTHDEAHSVIQGILDEAPKLTALAETWRRGAADDTAYFGNLIWCVYQHPDGEDPDVPSDEMAR